MRNLVICDDDPELCTCLQKYVERLAREWDEALNVKIYTSGEALLAGWAEDTDILLLDIQMGAMSGMDAARALRRQGSSVCIIFITNMTQYAMEGYEVHAFGFMHKPVQYERFRHVLEEALHISAPRQELVFSLRRGTSIKKVRAAEILYIEACGHEIRVVTRGGELQAGSALTEFEEQLQERGFFRCHKAYLINFTYVRQIEQKSITMTNGDEIPLSKHRRRDFLKNFARFAGVRL